MRMSPGANLLALHFFFTYVLFGILYEISSVHNFVYKTVPLKVVPFLVLVVVVVSILLLNWKKTISSSYPLTITIKHLSPNLQIAILLIVNIILVVGWYVGNSGFRYSQSGISEAGIFILIYSLVYSFVKFLIFIYIFFWNHLLEKKDFRFKILKLLLIISLLFSINGNHSALFCLIGIFYIIFPNLFQYFIYKNFYLKHKKIKVFISALFFPFLLAFAYLVGTSIKTSQSLSMIFDRFVTFDFIKNLYNYFILLVFSPSYVSMRQALFDFAFELDFNSTLINLQEPVKNFFYRFDTLLGNYFGVERPDVGSQGKTNYNLITVPEISQLGRKEGTSPGIIAGFLFSYPFPFNFIILGGYISFLKSFFDYLLVRLKYSLSLIGKILILVFFFTTFTSSPLDLLLIIDNMFFSFALYLILRFYILK